MSANRPCWACAPLLSVRIGAQSPEASWLSNRSERSARTESLTGRRKRRSSCVFPRALAESL
eukprot:810819-Pyramimonas_sp.AAC.1